MDHEGLRDKGSGDFDEWFLSDLVEVTNSASDFQEESNDITAVKGNQIIFW